MPLRAESISPEMARIIMTHSNGNYIKREIVSRLQSYLYANTDVEPKYNLDHICYSLGECNKIEGSKYEPGVYFIPVTIYLRYKFEEFI